MTPLTLFTATSSCRSSMPTTMSAVFCRSMSTVIGLWRSKAGLFSEYVGHLNFVEDPEFSWKHQTGFTLISNATAPADSRARRGSSQIKHHHYRATILHYIVGGFNQELCRRE